MNQVFAIGCSFLTALIIAVIWVYLIDKQNNETEI
jgi:hypothetical protein